MKMKLGWWRARDGSEHQIVRHWEEACIYPWGSPQGKVWADSGRYVTDDREDHLDLIEFIRPLEDLPPALNSGVKAAEDRVRTLKAHHAAVQKLADDALFILDEAKRELERLEKECEVKL